VKTGLIKEYNLGYTFDFAPHLYEITEADKAGNKLNSTLVTWNKSEQKNDTTLVTAATDLCGYGKIYPGDFTGDGKIDFVEVQTPPLSNDVIWTLYTANSAGNGFTLSDTKGVGRGLDSLRGFIPADFNNDGILEAYFNHITNVNDTLEYTDNYYDNPSNNLVKHCNICGHTTL